MSLKLMVDKKTKKVVFAEASKGVVDFIFHILSLLLATVVKFIQENKHEMSWSLDDLYKCIQSFDNACLETGFDKNSVLNPSTSKIGPLLAPSASLGNRPTYRYCSTSSCIYRNVDNYCLNHKPGLMISDSVSGSVSTMNPTYVKGTTSYVVMDNLETKLLSMSLIMFLTKDLTSVEQKEVKFGRKERYSDISIECIKQH
uniref:Uncharacterized protein n=1 Tax=Amaranthus palmeri TaxID=107608 RepID=A0A6C0T6R4_AMAPA|nr:hypothetical protein AP_R.00g000050-v1.0.a3 [Amaranthus palmeri]